MLERTHSRTFGVVLPIIVTLCFVVSLVVIDRAATHDRRVFKRIRNGELSDAHKLEFSGQKQHRVVTDTTSVRYFMAALRSARLTEFGDGMGSGLTYDLRVQMVDGSSLLLTAIIPSHNEGMRVYTNLEYLGINDPDYYTIRFPSPMPEALAHALERLR